MQGLMMDTPLQISQLIRHADRHHGAVEIVSKTVDGGAIHRYTYREAHARARQLANALKRLGVQQTDRVATLGWNNHRHFEIYYAVAGSGAVIHTINPRLFPDQIVYIANHAEDEAVFYDVTFAPLVEKLAPQLKTVKHWGAMTDRAHKPKICLCDARREARLSRPAPGWQEPSPAVRDRGSDNERGGAARMARPAQLYKRAKAQVQPPEGRDHRRLGLPARHDPHLPGRVWRR